MGSAERNGVYHSSRAYGLDVSPQYRRGKAVLIGYGGPKERGSGTRGYIPTTSIK